MTSNTLRWRLIGGGFVLAGLLAFVLLSVFSAEPEVLPLQHRPPLVEILPITPRPGTVIVRGQGFVRPLYRVSLSSQVSGEVIFVNPSLVPGGSFAAGDLLVELDPRAYQATVDQRQGEIAATRAQIEFAQAEVERLSRLAAANSASISALGQQRSELGRLEGQLASLQGALRQTQLNLEYTRLAAPFDGQVFEESVNAGDILQAGQGIAQLFATSVYEIVVSLDDNEAALIPGLWQLSESNAAVARVVAEFGGRQFAWPAQAQGVEAAIDQQTRTVNVVVRVADPTQPGQPLVPTAASAPPLVPGMYVTVEIDGAAFEQMATIPRAALRPQNQIWVALADGQLGVLPVDVLQTSEDQVVISGLPGQGSVSIVTSDLSVASPGMTVRTASKSVPGAAGQP